MSELSIPATKLDIICLAGIVTALGTMSRCDRIRGNDEVTTWYKKVIYGIAGTGFIYFVFRLTN